MRNLAFRFAVSLCTIALLTACQKGQEQQPQQAQQFTPTPAPSTTPAQPERPLVPPASPTPRATPRSSPQAVRLTRTESAPLMPLRGTVKAYPVSNINQLVPGQLADAALGDLVIENDLVRAFISRPGKREDRPQESGYLVDLVQQQYPVDYINFLRPVADVDTTRTQTVYDVADEPAVEAGTTATVVVHGYLGEKSDSDPETAPLHRIEGIDLTTTYALGKNENHIVLTTRFTNNSSAPISLAPGDLIDWGGASTFLEQHGIVGPPTAEPANWVLATSDRFSAGIATSGTKPMAGTYTQRFSVIRAVGKPGQLPSALAQEQREAAPKPTQAPAEVEEDQSPEAFRPTPAAAQPTRGTETSYAPAQPPSAETAYNALHRAAQPPASETAYRMPAVPQLKQAPAPKTSPAPKAPAKSTSVSLQIERTADSPREAMGGGGTKNADDPTTAPETSSSQAPGQEGTDPNRLLLKPGESFEFTRYLIVSDNDFSRISNTACQLKGIPTGMVAGVVIEQDSDQPVSGAEVRISGGPDWKGKSSPKAYTKVLTGADGTFALHLPYGRYVTSPFKAGRSNPASRLEVVELTSASATRLLVLSLTKESIVGVGVSEASAATSTPLPCKVTLVSKPGTPPLDLGFGPDVTKGVRNVFYLPKGGARIPVTPGRYQMTISHGIEYDIYQRDIEVRPASYQEIRASLPHVVPTRGMISMDAGVMTSASSTSLLTPEDLVTMAACEGVEVLVSGDFGTATDLTPAINALKLGNRVRAFSGMRFFVSKSGLSANVLVYPVTEQTGGQLKAFYERSKDVPPDIFLADLRKQFPNLIIEIDEAIDPDRGYLESFKFNEQTSRFEEGAIPPPDFDALQVLEGKKMGLQTALMPRYYELLIARTNAGQGAPPLVATAGSMARLPYGQEVGYPRTYLYTPHDTVDTVTSEDLVMAIKGQHIQVTNGPIVDFSVWNPTTGEYSAKPGDVVDYSTTSILHMKTRVEAAPWVEFSGMSLNKNGSPIRKTEVMSTKEVLRYPRRVGGGFEVERLTGDAFVDVIAFSNRRSLWPVVSPNPPDFGIDAMPLAWCGPIFIDHEGNGNITIKREH